VSIDRQSPVMLGAASLPAAAAAVTPIGCAAAALHYSAIARRRLSSLSTPLTSPLMNVTLAGTIVLLLAAIARTVEIDVLFVLVII